MNIDDRPTDDRPQGPFTHFGKISNGHISATRHPIPFMFGSRVGFRGRRIQRRHFRLDQIQDGGRRPSWKTSNGHIIYLSKVLGLSDSLYVCTQTILCRRSLIYNDGDSKHISLGRLKVANLWYTEKEQKADLKKQPRKQRARSTH